MIEKAKFTYSLLGKTSEKQSKVAGNQGEKQLKAIEDYRKKLVESNALISEIVLVSTKIAYHLKRMEYLINFLMKRLLDIKLTLTI